MKSIALLSCVSATLKLAAAPFAGTGFFLALGAGFFSGGCAATGSSPSMAESDSAWTVLFDGSSVEAWRGFRQEGFPESGWLVRDGILSTVPGRGHADIITRETYENFELRLEWRVVERGNSGIFFGVTEEVSTIWHYAPEFQILDDLGYNQKPDSPQATGSLYDLLGPSADKELKPVGEFNTARLVIRNRRVEHWLNGQKVLSYHLDDPALAEKIAASKFRVYDKFAQIRDGHIGLQHHGQEVAFRNIRIRRLD